MGLHTDGTTHGWDIHMKVMHTERAYTWRKHTHRGHIYVEETFI